MIIAGGLLASSCSRPVETPPPAAPSDSVPPPEETATATDEATANQSPVGSSCDAIRARIKGDLCGDESDCEDAEITCRQELDLDGDGTLDEVTFAEAEGKTVLRVAFGHGETSVLTGSFELTETPDLGQPWPPPSDETYPAELSWLVAWSVAEREGDELVRGSRFRAGPALGDALWMSGSDAAAMLMLTERGWLLVELGY